MTATSSTSSRFRRNARSRRLFAGIITIAVSAGGAAMLLSQRPGLPTAQERLLHAAQEPQNWLTTGGTYAEQRYSTLEQVNVGNVKQLGLAWSYEFDTNRGQEGTPLIVDGVLYTTTAWSKVVALDAATGRQLWTYDPKVPGRTGVQGCCDVVNRGPAYFDGKIYSATFDGRLVALDAKTGSVVWEVQTTDPSKPYTITGAPRVAKGKVFIGNGGAELGVRGYVTAYDAETGKKVWRFYTVPGDPAKGPDHEASDDVLASKAQSTWSGTTWIKSGGGGTVWDSIVYDPELDQLYIGVGNGSPWDFALRSDGKGDNLFLSSIVAVNPDTGKYIWHYQETPSESWDFTATNQIIQADVKIDGQPHKVLMQAPKNGFFYMLDRSSGKLLSAKNYVPVSWASGVDMKTGRPIEVGNARYRNGAVKMYPSNLGGHDWQPMSFSPKTGLVYIPAHIIPLPYDKLPSWDRRKFGYNAGINALSWEPPAEKAAREKFGSEYSGYLLAWDPIKQREVWRSPESGAWNGGTLSTAGQLVFAGNRDGRLEAFNAVDGNKLWAFQGYTGIMAGPVTYSVRGQQYVAVLAGVGGAYGLASGYIPHPRPQPNGRVLVFKIGGTAKLPADTSKQIPIADIKGTFTQAQVDQGHMLYAGKCSMCHGLSAQSSGVLPDLRRSAVVSDRATFLQVLLHGALEDQGMANFSAELNEKDADAIRAYIASKAKVAAKEEGKHP